MRVLGDYRFTTSTPQEVLTIYLLSWDSRRVKRRARYQAI